MGNWPQFPMRFTTRLILCAVAPASLFVLALGTSLWGLVRTQNDFNSYIGTEQAVATGLSELYAQGRACPNFCVNGSDFN
ncbi:hypothetical protein AVS7_00464 [Acidovorax sp. MR-S7]|nr:hypothetical protein AVS7_00464 [Acidovorax sp. MR-S7]